MGHRVGVCAKWLIYAILTPAYVSVGRGGYKFIRNLNPATTSWHELLSVAVS
jgi:hypothetical protein